MTLSRPLICMLQWKEKTFKHSDLPNMSSKTELLMWLQSVFFDISPPLQGAKLKLNEGSVCIENIRGVHCPEGRDVAAARRDEWAVRQDSVSRSPTDAGIKRACVAAHSAHIYQNCLRRPCPRASCPFLFAIVLLILSFPLYLVLDLCSHSFLSFSFAKNIACASLALFFFTPPCSSSAMCVWPHSLQAVCEISVCVLRGRTTYWSHC